MSPARKPKLPIDVYVRVSQVNGRDVEADGMTAAEQERKCRAQLEALDLTVGKVFRDLDQSGGKASRPEYDKMLARIANGQSGGVIVYKLSRFGRRVVNVLKDVQWIEGHDAAFICVNPGIDTSNAYGRFMLTVFAALDELELENLTEGWEFQRQKAIANGQHIGGVPAGYTRGKDGKLTPNQFAPHIVTAFEMRAAGTSITEIGAYLREAGVPAVNGQKREAKSTWSTPGVRSLLSSRTFLGEVRSGEFVQTGAHPAIIDEGLFRRVQRVNPQATRKGSRGNKPPALLQGIVKCATCGGPMSRDTSSRPDGTLYLMYRCKGQGCEKRAVVSLDILDSHVAYLVSELEEALLPAQPERDGEIEQLDTELKNVEAEIAETVEAFGAEGVSPTLAAKALAQLEGRKQQIEKALSEIEAPTGSITIPDELKATVRITKQGRVAVTGKTLYEQITAYPRAGNAFLKSVLERVDVRPGRGEIYERAEVIFRLPKEA